MVDYLSLVLLPEVSKLVTTEAPGVRLAVHALDAETISPRLQQGIVHVYIGVSGDTERALETQALFEDPLVVVVRRGHPLTRKRAKRLETYAEASHILVSPRRESGSAVTRALAAAGHDRRLALEVPYFGQVPDLLVESELVATVPRRIAEIYERDHPVELLEPPLDLPTIEICMAWHPTFASDPAQIWLRNLVARVCRELQPSAGS
jgi:DNA-binding transcriptional LysR family regulator